MARPKKTIDFDMLQRMCQIHCTKDEICNILDLDQKTLTRLVREEFGVGFSQYYKQHADEGKMSLRRAQMKVALAGNTGMLIWLGKQYLGQQDRQIIQQAAEKYRVPQSMSEDEKTHQADSSI